MSYEPAESDPVGTCSVLLESTAV